MTMKHLSEKELGMTGVETGLKKLEKQLSEELGYRKVAGEDVEELELIVIAVRRCLNGSF
mgnify:CR=1 FL=1